jgi:hypothetical protein
MSLKKIDIPLGTGSYESVSVPFSSARCVNLYASVAEDRALSDFCLSFTPGILAFATTESGASRGARKMGGVYYVVAGSHLYSIDSLGNETLIGAVTGTKRVVMADNGYYLCIVVPGGDAFTYNANTDTFAQITDGDYQTSDTVSFKDGYFIFTATDGTNFFISDLNDPTSYDALMFGSAELSPDKIVASLPMYDELYIFGEETTEVFSDIGGDGFPWQRISGASFEKGCHGKYTPIRWGSYFYWVGGGVNEKSAIYQAGGGIVPIQISTNAIAYQIQKFTPTEISNAFSFAFSFGGNDFIGFTFRSVNVDSRTFLYNVTASKILERNIWSEQQTGITTNAWRIESIDNVYGKLLVSDTIDGRIGYLDEDTQTEYDDIILREKITPPLRGPMIIKSMEMIVDAGLSTLGLDPSIMMDFSLDGGRTWSTESWEQPIGESGEYFRRVKWFKLGRIPLYIIFRFRITDPVKTTIISLSAMVANAR